MAISGSAFLDEDVSAPQPSAEAFLSEGEPAEGGTTKGAGDGVEFLAVDDPPAGTRPSAAAFLGEDVSRGGAEGAEKKGSAEGFLDEGIKWWDPRTWQLDRAQMRQDFSPEKVKELQAALGVMTTPMAHVPKVTASDLAGRGLPPGTEKVAAGVERGAANLVDFFLSPLGIATLGIGALPAAAQRVIAGGFALDMARRQPEAAAAFGQAVGEGDTEKAVETGIGLAANTGMTALAGAHAVAGKGKVGALVGQASSADSASVTLDPTAAAAPEVSPELVAELAKMEEVSRGGAEGAETKPSAEAFLTGDVQTAGVPEEGEGVRKLREEVAAMEDQPGKQETKGAVASFERAPDVLDWMESQGVKLRKVGRGEASDFTETQRKAQQGTPEAFDAAGLPPDDVAEMYRRATGRDLSDEDFVGEVGGVKAARAAALEAHASEYGKLSQDAAWAAEAGEGIRRTESKGLRTERVENVGAEELGVGDKFEVGGERVVVERVKARPDDETMVESVTVKDGPKFGTRVLPGDFTLKIDEGSLQRAELKGLRTEGGGFEAWADRVIEAAKGRVSSGLDPELLAAYAVKGAAVLVRGVVDAGAWAAEMVRQYGDRIREHLPAIRAKAEAMVREGKVSRGDAEGAEGKMPEGMGERAFPKQVDLSSDVSNEVRLRQGPRLYEPRTNEGDAELARRVIAEQGLERAGVMFRDESNGLPESVRTALGLEAVKAWGLREQVASLSRAAAGERAAVEAQVDLLEAATRRSTDMAQGLQAMSMWSRLTPAGQIEAGRRTIEGARQAGIGAMRPGLENIKDTLQAENEKIAPAVVDAVRPEVEKVIEESADRSSAIKAELARQILQLWNSLWTESKVWQDLVSERGMRVMEIAREHYAGVDPGKTLATKLHDELKIGVKEAFKMQKQMDAEFARMVKKAAKEAAARAKKLAEREEARRKKISTDGTLWGREKAAATDQLVAAAKGRLLPGRVKGPMEEFAGRLARQLRSELLKRLPTRAKAVNALTEEQLLQEAANHAERYNEVWGQAQDAIRTEFADKPDALKELDRMLGTVAPDLFSARAVDVLLRREMAARTIDLQKLVTRHFTEVGRTGEGLAEMIASRLNVADDRARWLAEIIQRRFNEMATEAKRAALRKLSLPARIGPTLAKGLHEKLIELSNLGALDDAAFDRAVSEKLGLPQWTREMAMEVKRRAEAMQRLPGGATGFQRTRAAIDMMNYIARAKGVKWQDLAWGFWYANVLSGPVTHAVNAGANALNLAANIGMTMARQGGRGMPGLYAAVARGLGKGTIEAAQMMKEGMVTGSRLPKVEALRPLEIAEFKGVAAPLKLWRYVARAMGAADLIFFKSAEEMRSYAAAQEIGVKEGLRGEDLQRRVVEILGQTEERIGAARAQADAEGLSGLDWRRRVDEVIEQSRPDILRENAKEYALRVTFNEKPYGVLGAIAKGIHSMRREVPALQAIVPFVDIVANVTNEGLNYFPPVGAVRAIAGHYSGALEGKAITDRDVLFDQYAKAAMGTALLGSLYLLHQSGKLTVTGAGPRTPAQKKQLQETGWIPYSVKLGDKYYAYGWTPAAIPVAVLGNYLDAETYKNLDATDAGNRAAYALAVSGKVIMQQSFLSGVADLVNFLETDSTKKAGAGVASGLLKTGTSLVVPNAVRTIDRIFDPTVYDANDIEGQLVAAVPFARRLNRPAINVLGEPVEKYVSDRFVSSERGDALWGLLAAKQAWVSVPDRDVVVGNKKEGPGFYRTLSDGEYYLYVLESGRAIRQELVSRLPEIAGATPDEAKEIVRRVTVEAREAAKPRF